MIGKLSADIFSPLLDYFSGIHSFINIFIEVHSFTCKYFHRNNLYELQHDKTYKTLSNSITSRGTDNEQHWSWSDCADAQAGLDPCSGCKRITLVLSWPGSIMYFHRIHSYISNSTEINSIYGQTSNYKVWKSWIYIIGY
jgi:hypothetical protein